MGSQAGSQRDDVFLLMSPAQVFELFVWLEFGARERSSAIAREVDRARAQRMRWGLSMCRRIGTALEWYVIAKGHGCSREDWRRFSSRGTDEYGLACFARYLAQQRAYWSTAGAAGTVDVEAQVRLKILGGASNLFYSLLKLTPDEIERRAAQLKVDQLRLFRADFHPGSRVKPPRELGPLPPEDLLVAVAASKKKDGVTQ